MADGENPRTWDERVLDQILPDDLDWRQKVTAYPRAALIVAGTLGFLLGRSRGARVFGALAGVAADRVTATLAEALRPDDS